MQKLLKFSWIGSALLLAACDPLSLIVGSTIVAGTVTVRDKEGIPGLITDKYLKEKLRLAEQR